MKKMQGYAIIIVLLWLTLISLLTIDALEANLIETQLTAHDWQRLHLKAASCTGNYPACHDTIPVQPGQQSWREYQ